MIVDQTSNRPLPRGVRRAVDAMREDFGQKRSVTELAAVAGVSSRTLQRQFLTFVRKTPRAVARDIGFDNARRELLQGAPSAKVMDIAARSGFPHCGRFSVEYRRRYGETPSQTLKRQAFFLAALGSPRSSFVPSGGWPTIALCKIEAEPEHFEIAANISEDLTSALTRAGISVVSEARSARYQLIGAIRGTGRQTRLVFRMIDRGSGRQLWAHRTDGALVDAAEKQLATRIAAALQPCLRLAEVDHALRKPDPDLSADDLALRAMPGVLSLDDEGNARALELLDCAMEYDPKHALATALAAWAHIQRVTYCFSSDPQHDLARSRALAEKARTLSGNAMVLAVLGNALTLLSELDAADLVIRKALSLDGGSAWAWGCSGWIDTYRGDSESAIERFKISLDLAPQDPLAFNNMVGLGCAYFTAGKFAEAARWQQRALIELPSARRIQRTMCPAHLLPAAASETYGTLSALRQQYRRLAIS